jgi:hypothetical protein
MALSRIIKQITEPYNIRQDDTYYGKYRTRTI